MKCTSIFIGLLWLLTDSIVAQTLEIPTLDSVSINHLTQRTVIGWHIKNPEKIDGYIIKRQIFGVPGVIDGAWNTIATIRSADITSYEDSSIAYNKAQPNIRAENYRVVSYKKNNDSIVYSSMSLEHNTIFLSKTEYDICIAQNTLTWTPYNAWNDSIIEYRIFMKSDIYPHFLLLNIVSGTTYIYEHKNLITNINYRYYIQAVHVDNERTSSSNIDSIFANKTVLPKSLHADYATVTSYNQVDLLFSLDSSAQIKEYRLVKADSINDTFNTIAAFSNTDAQIRYTDNTDIYHTVSRYAMIAVDICDRDAAMSNLAHNIVLYASAFDNRQINATNNLKWNSYIGWSNDVKQYNIYRSVGNNGFALIDSLAAIGDTIFYNDRVDEFVGIGTDQTFSTGEFCYYIEALSDSDEHEENKTYISRSNISCAAQQPFVYVPNAFNPVSLIESNRQFRPVISFASGYLLIIYSRWGDKIYESKNPIEGWDGTINGTPASEGVYAYYLKFISAQNKTIEKSGYVTLIYP